MQDVVAALVADALGHRGVPVLLTPAGRKSQPIAAVRAEDVADEQGAALTVALVHVPALFKVEAIWHGATCVAPHFRHLTEAGLDTDRGLDALS